MPSVTVLGVSHETITLSYDSATTALIASWIAAAITQGVETGSITPVDGGFGAIQIPPPLASGQTGEFVQKYSGMSIMMPGYRDVVVTAGFATVLGSGDAGEAILSSEGELTFLATGGSGTVVAGGVAPGPSALNNAPFWQDNAPSWQDNGHAWLNDGRASQGGNGAFQLNDRYGRQSRGDLIIVPGSDNGAWGIYTGGGNDTVLALGGGNDTIAAGGGRNIIELGGGDDSVQSTGQDTIITGSGRDTIGATDDAQDLVRGGIGGVVFFGGAGEVTLFGGAGSDTFVGGSGRALVFGGRDGSNSLLGGTGEATLFGGGAGDRLFAQGANAQALIAGIGNETLSAEMATGNNSLVAEAGSDLLIGGSGSDTFYGGAGTSTMVGGSGNDIFAFVRSLHGGTDLVMNFTSADKIALLRFGSDAIADALASQTFANGSVTITLPDNTRVTFADVSQLTKNDFI